MRQAVTIFFIKPNIKSIGSDNVQEIKIKKYANQTKKKKQVKCLR